MPLDVQILAALAYELDTTLRGSRVEKVLQPDEKTLVLRVFPPRDRMLVLHTDEKLGHAALLGRRIPGPPVPPNFCQLVRSRLQPSRIVGVGQVAGDRILEIRFQTPDAQGPASHALVLELFGATPDLYLIECAGGRVLGHLRRRELPARLRSGTYHPPPPPPGEDPLRLERAELTSRLARAREAGGEGWKRLVRELAGVVPELARRTVALAASIGDAGAAEELVDQLGRVSRGTFEPGLVQDAADGPQLMAAPLGRWAPGVAWEPVPDLSTGLERTWTGRHEADRLTHRIDRARRLLARMRAREEARLEHTRTGLHRARGAADLERLGNLLKTQLHAVRPFEDFAEVVDYYAEGTPTIRIPIKVGLKPVRNVDRYFLKARKLRASLPRLEARESSHRRNLELLTSLSERLEAVGSLEELDPVVQRIEGLGRTETGRAPVASSAGRRRGPDLLTFLSSDGLKILVGRNNRENDLITRKHGRGEDVWLHAQGIPGAHVIVKLPGSRGVCPPRTLEEAAQLAAHYSKARFAGKVDVMVSRAHKVRRGPGLAPGQVLVDAFETLVVRPDATLPNRLEKPL